MWTTPVVATKYTTCSNVPGCHSACVIRTLDPFEPENSLH